MAELGCNPTYQASVIDAGGSAVLEIPFTSLAWGRALNATSEAAVAVDIANAPECCDTIAGLRTWRQQLHLYRDGGLVWEGPITRIKATRGEVAISAHDPIIWLTRRVIHTTQTITGDLATIAKALIVDAMTVNNVFQDPEEILKYLTVTPTGITGTRTYTAGSGYVWDAITELLRTGLDLTALGRRLIVGVAPGMSGTVAQLGCDDFAGDIAVIEDGLSAVTRAFVNGKGVQGVAGGVDDYFGLIEFVTKDEQIEDTPSATASARHYVSTGNPPPVYVEPPSGSTLVPTAPVTIPELVPGARVPVLIDCTCRPSWTDLILSKVAVTYGVSGESVSVTLVPNTTVQAD